MGAKGGGTTYEGKLGHEFLEKCFLCSLCWIFAGGPPREEGACHHCQTEGPKALGFWNIQDQLFITYSNQRVSAKATSREISPTCLLPDRAGCVTVLETFLQLSKMRFLGGVKTYGVAGISVGGGGGNVWLKTAFPGTAGTIGRGGVNVWSKEGGGENVPNFWSPEIKKRSHPEPRKIFNHCLHRTLLCPWVAMVRS